MRGTKAGHWKVHSMVVAIITTFFYMLVIGSCIPMSVNAYTQTEGKVTATTANIRKEASASSEVVASVKNGDKLSIKDEKTGADGNVWYQVFVDANTLGYIRSDLVEKSGSSSSTNTTPATNTNTNTNTNTSTVNDTITAEITKVNPISATVKSEQVRVRKNCTTSSSIVTIVKKDVALTVIGTALDSDSKTWYQVSFISDGTEVTGFIRSDYVNLSGEITPYSENVVEPSETPDVPTEENLEAVPVSKPYETQLIGEEWYLINNDAKVQYKIDKLITTAEKNAIDLEESLAKGKTQNLVIIILVVILCVLALVVVLGIYKFKDILFEDIFDKEEAVPVRRRPVEQQRPTRPAGQGQRPAGSPQQRPVGNRPRPEGSPKQRPVGATQRPTENVKPRPRVDAISPAFDMTEEAVREEQIRSEASKSLESQRIQKETGMNSNKNAATRAPKNFMADDEFEFEFLNWDGEEEE